MPKVVTSADFELDMVTIEVAHGDLLVKVGAALARWQGEAARISQEMAKLLDAGVFLDGAKPVVPGWWERKDGGHHVAWYLVWPRGYARRAEIKRRQYVKATDLEATRAKVKRTLEYADLRDRHAKRQRKIELVGGELAKLAAIPEW